MFDPSTYVLQGVSLLSLVFGLVEFIKDVFNLSGKVVTVISALCGAFVMVAYQLSEVLPGWYGIAFKTFVLSLAFGLSASGYYKFLAQRLPKQEE